MTATAETTGAGTTAVSVEDVRQFLYREARYLDDREFETWLECYHPDVEFWMPAWDDNGELTEDPQSEISLIYYDNRGGLEDRVFRIRTDRSAATSMPEPRTGHNITDVEVLERRGEVGNFASLLRVACTVWLRQQDHARRREASREAAIA